MTGGRTQRMIRQFTVNLPLAVSSLMFHLCLFLLSSRFFFLLALSSYEFISFQNYFIFSYLYFEVLGFYSLGVPSLFNYKSLPFPKSSKSCFYLLLFSVLQLIFSLPNFSDSDVMKSSIHLT